MQTAKFQSQRHSAFGPAMRQEDYAAALRHSARVRRLKFLMPVFALVILAAFLAVSFVRAILPENISIQFAKIENGKIVMEKPALSGRNSNGQPYTLVAERALQDIKNPNLLSLEAVNAEMPDDNGGSTIMRAPEGLFDRDKNSLELTAPFDVELSSGINAHFNSADIDVSTGGLVSNDPVSIVTKDASIVANSFVMDDKSGVMTLGGNVKMLIDPKAIRRKKEE